MATTSSTGGIRANSSRQELIRHEEFSNSGLAQHTGPMMVDYKPNNSSRDGEKGLGTPESASTEDFQEPDRKITRSEIITVTILCFVNLINYMDRFTLAGILTDIQCFYNIGDTEGGLLQTAFILSYMVFAPMFGYLGDRYSRRALMACGIFLWSLTTLMGSFADNFHLFIGLRAMVGIGEASYSTIAPTIISDLFVKDMRSKMLALFYFAIPVGSGLGYIVGSEFAKLGQTWQWGLRVTPVLGGIAVLLVLFVMRDPPRGECEGSHLKPTSWWADIKSLCKNRSFMLSTIASMCVAFVAGALAWWGPKFITLGLANQPGQENVSMDDVAYIFGLITMISGLVGVPLGSFLGQKLRTRYPRADPLVCAFGLLASTPLMLASMYVASISTPACFTLVFFGELFLNLNWAIVADILLYVVIPTRRATAEAFQILISHAFGDAGSPYLIGQVSEILKRVLKPDVQAPAPMMPVPSLNASLATSSLVFDPPPTTPMPWNCSSSSIDLNNVDVEFTALQYALFITAFVEVIGGAFFLMSAWYLVEDKAKVTRALQTQNNYGMPLECKTPIKASQASIATTTTVVLGGEEDNPTPLEDPCHRRARLYAGGDSTPEEEEPMPAITS